jgi:starch phosphorylase
VAGAWKDVAVRHVESLVEGDPTLGGVLQLRAEVALADLSPADVIVEAVFGSVDADNRLISTDAVTLTVAEEKDGAAFFVGDLPLTKAGPFGYTVRVLPHNDLLANSAEMGLIALAG